eukprot:3936164-Rhodomonas_salina.2
MDMDRQEVCSYAPPTRCPVLTKRSRAWCYAPATRCPVLTYCISSTVVPTCYAMCCTGVAYHLSCLGAVRSTDVAFQDMGGAMLLAILRKERQVPFAHPMPSTAM